MLAIQHLPHQHMATAPQAAASVQNGQLCAVTAGTHKGKSGTVRDLNTSKTGAVTLTVVQANGERFKTLAKNVALQAGTDQPTAQP